MPFQGGCALQCREWKKTYVSKLFFLSIKKSTQNVTKMAFAKNYSGKIFDNKVFIFGS